MIPFSQIMRTLFIFPLLFLAVANAEPVRLASKEQTPLPVLPGGKASDSTGVTAGDDLVIAADGKTRATVVVSPGAGKWEKQAAADLVKYIGIMTGGQPALADVPAKIAAALAAAAPVFIIGEQALAVDPTLRAALAKVAKPKPVVRADAVVMRRKGNHVLLAGTNDESHYFAVTGLLQDWGCRWYLPTDFGECIPEKKTLTLGQLDHAYAPPFEIRHYWLSWNADGTGADEFRRRNFMTETSMAGMGHALGQYTKNLVPPGKSVFNVPLAEGETARKIVEQIEGEYAKGVPGISLAIEDGNYVSDSPKDKELQAGLWDKYAHQPSQTDAMMTLYNNVARLLHEKHPNSPTKIGGMAYANVTIPPQRVMTIEPNLVMWLAPIDIDPNHAMDDPKSAPKTEYRAMLDRWAKLMEGRLVIYDYDQGQLVWRDLPNPSHHMFARDARIYRDAKILGIGTESRGAMATIFTNLFFRGQLMWNPDADVPRLLAEFFPAFYGPAAAPMAAYWGAIHAAWEKTVVTEHEYFAATAIYTPDLIAHLEKQLAAARPLLAPFATKSSPTRNERLYLERLRFTELSFQVIQSYAALSRAGASECDFAAAVAAGEKGLVAREALTAMNGTFTTYKNIGENGAAWWPGEVAQMRDLNTLTDGSKGTLIAKAPLEWAFRRDPHDSGLASGWAYTPADASWEKLRADLYLQAQGILHPDGQSYTGHYWYQTALELDAAQVAGKPHLIFPGLFNECWLYVNGRLVAHRVYSEPWWKNDYKFEWDVDLAGALQPGRNLLTLRGLNPHHFGGMFRRPFLYRPLEK